MMGIDILSLLDEMDEFRRSHQDERESPSDYCMRVMEAIVAKAAGYSNRNEWTDALKARPCSKYSQDLKDPYARF